MATREITLQTKGMHCPSCAMLVEMSLTRLDGVKAARSDYATELTQVTYDDDETDVEALVDAVVDAGYEGAVAR